MQLVVYLILLNKDMYKKIKIENAYYDIDQCDICGRYPKLEYVFNKKNERKIILKCKNCGNTYNVESSYTKIGAVNLWNSKGQEIYHNSKSNIYPILIFLVICIWIFIIICTR